MEKFQEIAERWLAEQRELRKACIEYLTGVLKEHGNKLTWDECDMNAGISVSYDGGNHPEYASNVFSSVYGLSLDNKGNISIDTEDDSDYDIENVNTDEVYDIADFVENIVLPYQREEQ